MQGFDRRDRSLAVSATASPAEMRLLRDVGRYDHVGRFGWWGVRALGALSLLAVGAVHLQQYLYLYSAIPTIGTLFVLDFAAATAIGLALLLPVERLLDRWGGPAVLLLALAGVGQAATSFAFLLISERTPLFGFREPGYDPPALMASRAAELTTVALLGLFLAARVARRIKAGRW
jgi:hypothetical protein